MKSKRPIVLDIGGNTQPLEKALQDVNNKSRDLQSELKTVERLLKLDPSNTNLLAQKQELLAKSVNNAKDKAEKMLRDYIKEYEDRKTNYTAGVLFGEYILDWLENRKNEVEQTTWNGYEYVVKKHIKPYFDKTKIILQDLQPSDLQKYYNKKFKEGLSSNTIRKHHANIRKALQDALIQNIIPYNIADRVKLPKIQQKNIDFYNKEQVVELLKYTKSTSIETCVLLSATFGLRRSEVLGLKWDAIDFTKNTITISNTVTNLGGIIEKERTKNKSSHRTMPLTNEIKQHLEKLKVKQKKNRLLFGSSYSINSYVCKYDDGRPLSPDFVSHKFKGIVDDNNLEKITFHGLRHSCASILLAEGFDIKMVQEFLGHSSIVTTGNIYAHIQYSSKVEMGNALSKMLL